MKSSEEAERVIFDSWRSRALEGVEARLEFAQGRMSLEMARGMLELLEQSEDWYRARTRSFAIF